MATMATKLRHSEIRLPAGECWLDGILGHPPEAPGLVVLVERSGSTLKTARGAFIADAMGAAGFATLQVALLSRDEERRSPDTWRHAHSLSPRITAILEWIGQQAALNSLPLGMLARDEAAASMIRVAAQGNTPLRAIACRDGRPDLAGIEPLRTLETPFLLVVGQLDGEALERNRQVFALLTCPKQLEVIEGASHAFEEIGALDQASRAMTGWFHQWLDPTTG